MAGSKVSGIEQRILGSKPTVAAVDSNAYRQHRCRKPAQSQPKICAIVNILARGSSRHAVAAVNLHSKGVVLQLRARWWRIPNNGRCGDGRRRRWRRSVGRRGSDRRSKTHAVAASLETGRHRAPVLLTAQIVVRRSHSAAILRRVEACLTFRPKLTFGAIRGQLHLSLAELRRNGK